MNDSCIRSNGVAWVLAMFSICVGFAAGAYGGCVTIPSLAQNVRRNQVCAAVGLETGCFLDPRSVTEMQIQADEYGWFELRVGGTLVGKFPMENPQPVDPSACVDREYVEELLRFHMGSAEIQARIRALVPQVSEDEIAYFDRLQVAERAGEVCKIIAEAMVVGPKR